MDINLKSNDKKENKILTSLIIILILFIASVGMFKTYPFISKLAKDKSYNYLENYMYTSTYQDIAVQLNKEINRKIDEPILQKTTIEKYKEFDENISEEVKDYLEKD